MRRVWGSRRGARGSESGTSSASVCGPNLFALVCRRTSCALRSDDTDARRAVRRCFGRSHRSAQSSGLRPSRRSRASKCRPARPTPAGRPVRVASLRTTQDRRVNWLPGARGPRRPFSAPTAIGPRPPVPGRVSWSRDFPPGRERLAPHRRPRSSRRRSATSTTGATPLSACTTCRTRTGSAGFAWGRSPGRSPAPPARGGVETHSRRSPTSGRRRRVTCS